jgi:hypothetical protein
MFMQKASAWVPLFALSLKPLPLLFQLFVLASEDFPYQDLQPTPDVRCHLNPFPRNVTPSLRQ